MRLLVTGAGGLIGWHLVEAAALRGDVVRAWARHAVAPGWPTGIETAATGLFDPAALAQDLAAFAPDAIVHLAAQSLPGPSWADPITTYQVNVLGTINLIEAARALPRPPRLLLAGSSAEYAEPVGDEMITERSPLEPNNPYGASKLAAEEYARLCARRYGQDIVFFRPFFLLGPRKKGDVCSDFARRIVGIERGGVPVMKVGDLRPVRDMMDVRDGVDAILRIIASGQGGEVYNICSGTSITIADILETYRGMARVQVTVEQDQALLRPLDHKSKIGDPARLHALGWQMRHKLDDTLRGILDYWRTVPD